MDVPTALVGDGPLFAAWLTSIVFCAAPIVHGVGIWFGSW
jgi:hypothetical protein